MGTIENSTLEISKMHIDQTTGPDVGCLLHSRLHRARFQQVLNLVRDKVIPAYYVFKLNHLVCVCKVDNQKAALDTAVEQLGKDNIVTTLEENIEEYEAPLKKSLQFYLSSKDRSSKKQAIQEAAEKSSLRLFVLLNEAHKENFSLFEPQILEIDSGEMKPNRGSYPYQESLAIPMPTSMVGQLFGMQGRNMKPLCEKHQASIMVPTVDFGCPGYRYNHIPYSNTFSIVVKSKSRAGLTEMSKELKEAVKRICENSAAHAKRVVEYSEKRAARRQRNESDKLRRRRKPKRRTHFGNGGVSFATFEKKVMDRNNYSRKYLHDQRKSDIRQREKQRPKVLEQGSRCAQCLQPYDPGWDKGHESCKFHTGYIKDPSTKLSVWSCCSINIKDSTLAGQEESHALDGCKTAQHVWKLHKRNPVKKTSYDAERGAGRGRMQKGVDEACSTWLDD